MRAQPQGSKPDPTFSLANSPVSPVDRLRLLTAPSNLAGQSADFKLAGVAGIADTAGDAVVIPQGPLPLVPSWSRSSRRCLSPHRLAGQPVATYYLFMVDLFFQSCQGLDDAGELRDFTEDHHPHGIVVLL